MAVKVYFLRSSSSSCPDILLKPGIEVILGRGPITGITDSRLSRRHVRVVLEKDFSVSVTQLGPNHSRVNGQDLILGSKSHLQQGQTIELLEGVHQFKVLSSVSQTEEMSKVSPNAERKPKNQTKPNSAHWSQGLLASMNDPEMVIFSTENLVVIKDKYPKAKHHYLILPRKKIKDLMSLTMGDLELLKELEVAADRLVSKHPKSEFKIGYHAVPSMAQVHLHVISTDFESDCLKHKKHWNSFNTDYFVNSSSVIEEIETNGYYSAPSQETTKKLLNTPLKCNRCDYVPVNFPDLKRHLSKCNVSLISNNK